jgi:hypothetical protein
VPCEISMACLGDDGCNLGLPSVACSMAALFEAWLLASSVSPLPVLLALACLLRALLIVSYPIQVQGPHVRVSFSAICLLSLHRNALALPYC